MVLHLFPHLCALSWLYHVSQTRRTSGFLWEAVWFFPLEFHSCHQMHFCISSGTPSCGDSEMESRSELLPQGCWVILILNLTCQHVSEQGNILLSPAWEQAKPQPRYHLLPWWTQLLASRVLTANQKVENVMCYIMVIDFPGALKAKFQMWPWKQWWVCMEGSIQLPGITTQT